LLPSPTPPDASPAKPLRNTSVGVDPDYRALAFWVDVAQWFMTIVVAVYVWLTSRHTINKKAIDQVKQEMDRMEDDLIQIRELHKHQPTMADVRNLERHMSGLQEKQNASMHLLKIIHKHLLSSGK
jgi:hypothetical protein